MSAFRKARGVDYDAAVIGAGPAGSGIAAALAAHGWSVLLIERDRFPRHKVCGEFLSPEALGTLRTLGLYADLAAVEPASLTHAELISRRGSRLVTMLPAPGWGVSRYAMDAVLADAAVNHGVTLWQACSVIEAVSHASATEVVVRRGAQTEHVWVRAAILAGGRAVSPKLLSRPFPKEAQRLNVGVKAHFRGVTMPARVEVYLFDGGYVGINPVETGAANICLLASYAAFAKAQQSPRQMFERIARQNRAFGERLAHAELIEETLCSVAAVDTGRPSRPWNGMACLGDTATMIPPLCGDGMAMALHSAALCARHADRYLRSEIDLAGWARGYTDEWHAAFDSRLRVGRLLQALLNSGASDLMLKLGQRAPMVADYFTRATRGPVRSSRSLGTPIR